MERKRDGFAIALAWPETFCKQSSAWYDPIMHVFKITKNNHYQVGHSAIVLVDKYGRCFYYDFGRYHAPYGFGRVRSHFTDSELSLHSKAEIHENKIVNFSQILEELSHKKECHGEGKLWASYTQIDFEKAKEKADLMQQNSPLNYGPFIYNGTNCSRFVRKIILAGKPSFYAQLKLISQYTLTASPILNVTSLSHFKILNSPRETPKVPEKKSLKSVLERPKNQPHHMAKWFSGEGAGSWFVIQTKDENCYFIERFSPEFDLECATEMKLKSGKKFDAKSNFQLIYPCNSQGITLQQDENIFRFEK